MEPIWLKHYPAAVPRDVNTSLYPSLVDLLDTSFKKNAAKPAYLMMGKSISFAQVDDASRAMAAYLQGLGLEKGDRVAINPNQPCRICRTCVAGKGHLCLKMNFYGSAAVFPHIQGVFREVIVASEAQCFPVPQSCDFRTAAMAEPPAVYWARITRGLRITGSGPEPAAMQTIFPWLVHNAIMHLTVAHGLEQYSGAAWGTRDVCQGPVEFLLALGHDGHVKDILRTVFSQQSHARGDWPQWFMLPPYAQIRDRHSHGDVIVWPLKALCDYVEATGDLAFLDQIWPALLAATTTDPRSDVLYGPRGPMMRWPSGCSPNARPRGASSGRKKSSWWLITTVVGSSRRRMRST